jgi:hypothetical protein
VADSADQSSTGQISIGLDTSQFKAGTQAILADIRLLTQGLNQFEVAGSKVGSSFRGLRQASLSLKQFRNAVDADAIPALRKLQTQANASAASLSRVFNIGAQPNNAVSGIQRVTNALAAQERQAMRTADAMARAAMSQNRTGAMAFRNAGRSGSGSFGRGGAGTGAAGTRGARSSLDDSGAAARSIPSIAGISRAALGLELSKRSGMRKAGIAIEGRTGDTGPSYDTDPDFIRREARSQLLSRLSSRDLGRFISRLVASETGDVSYPSEPLDLRNFAWRGNRFGPPKPKRRSGRYDVQQGDLALFEAAIEQENLSLLQSALRAPQGRMREDVRRMPAYLQRMIETARRARRRSSTFFPRTSPGKPMSVHVPGRGLMEFSKKSGRGGSGGNKDIDRIVGQVLGQGWRIEKGKNHKKLVSPSGAPVFYPSSASDRRALQNFISTLRKKGAVVDGRGYGGKEGKGGPREMSRRSGSRSVAETAFGFVPDRRILEAIRRGDMSFGQEIGAQRLNTKRLSTTVSMGTGRDRVRGTAIAMIPENDRGLKGQRDGREVGRNLGQGDRKTRRKKLSPYSPMAEKVYEVLGGMLGAPTPAVVRRRLTPLEQQLATGGRLPQVGSSARTNIGATRRIASGKFQHTEVRQHRPLSRNAWMIPWLENFETMGKSLPGNPVFNNEIETQATRHLGSTRDMRRIMLLDQILGQSDRHGSNIMVGKGRSGRKRIVGIDNEHLFSMRGLDRPISDLDRQLNNTPQFSSFSARYKPREIPQSLSALLPWNKGGGTLSRVKLNKQEQDASAREAKTLRGILGGKRSMKIVEESFLSAGYSYRDTKKYMETLRTRLEAAAITREAEASSGSTDAGQYYQMLQMSRRSGAQRKLAARTRATGRGVMLPQDLPSGDFAELPRPIRLLGEMLQRKQRDQKARPVTFEDETRTSLVTGKEFIPGRASRGSRPIIPQNLAGRSPEQIFAEALVASHNAGMRVREIAPDPERLINAQLQAMGVSVQNDGNVRRITSRADQMAAARAYQLFRRQRSGMGSIATLAPGSVLTSSALMDATDTDRRARADMVGSALDEMSGFDAFREVSAGTPGARRDRRAGQSGNRRIGLTGGFIATAPNRFYVPGMEDAAGLRNLVVGAMTHRMPGTGEQGKLAGLSGLGVPGVGTSLMAYELRRHARATMEARRRYPGALEAKYGVSPEDLPRLNMRPGSPGGLSLKASERGMGLYEALGFEFTDLGARSSFMHMGGDKVVDMYGKIRAEIKRVEARLAEQGIAYSPMEFARRSGKTSYPMQEKLVRRMGPGDPNYLGQTAFRLSEENLLGSFTRGTRFYPQNETYVAGPRKGQPIPRPSGHRGIPYYQVVTPSGLRIDNVPADAHRGRLQEIIAAVESFHKKYPEQMQELAGPRSTGIRMSYEKLHGGATGTASVGSGPINLMDYLLTPDSAHDKNAYFDYYKSKNPRFASKDGLAGRAQSIHGIFAHELGHVMAVDKYQEAMKQKGISFYGYQPYDEFVYGDRRDGMGRGARGYHYDYKKGMAQMAALANVEETTGGRLKPEDFYLPGEIDGKSNRQGGAYSGFFHPGSKKQKTMYGSNKTGFMVEDVTEQLQMRKIGEMMLMGKQGPLASVLPKQYKNINEAMQELWKIGGYGSIRGQMHVGTEWMAQMFAKWSSRAWGAPDAALGGHPDVDAKNKLGYRVARILARNNQWAEYSKRSGGIGGMLGGLFGRGRPNIMQQITGGQTYGMTLQDLLGGDITGMGSHGIGHWSGGAGKQILALKTLTGEVRNVLAQPMEGKFPNKAMEILAGLLGVDTPTILERSIGGRRMAIQPMAPGETAIDFVNKRNAPPSKMVDVWEDDEIIGRFSQPLGPRSDDPALRDKPWLASRGGRRMQILDHLGQTFDRHGLNYLLNLADPKGGVGSPGNYRVTAIDHDLTLSPPGTGRIGQQPYRPASDVPIGIPGKFRDTQTKLAREEAATLAGIMTRRKVIEPQLLEALRAGGYSEQEALATVDAIFRRAREAFRSRMAESRGAARPDGRELSRRSGGGSMNGLTNPFAEYSKRSGGAATGTPYTALQTAFEQVTLTAIKNLKVSLAGQKMNPSLFRQSIESFQKTILEAATGQGEFAGGSMQKALRGIAPKARKSIMGMFSGILKDIEDTGTAAFKSGDLKGIPLRKVLFSMLGQVPSTYAPDIAQIAANPALQKKKPSGPGAVRLPSISTVQYGDGPSNLTRLGGAPIPPGLRLAGSATLASHLTQFGNDPKAVGGLANILADFAQKFAPPGVPGGIDLQFGNPIATQGAWASYSPVSKGGTGTVDMDLGGRRQDPVNVTLGGALTTLAHEFTHAKVDNARLETADRVKGVTDPAERARIEREVYKKIGVPVPSQYRVFSGISGEDMFVPKGSKVGGKTIPLGDANNLEGFSYFDLPKGAIAASKYKALSPKEKAGYEPAYVDQKTAADIDPNAQGMHINVPGHFGPQVRMLEASRGAGLSQYAELLAQSTQILQPGETEASLALSTRQMNAGARKAGSPGGITDIGSILPGIAGGANPYQGGLLRAFDLSQHFGTALKPVAEFAARLRRNMSGQLTGAAAAGGVNPKDLGAMFARALEGALKATPASERSKVFESIRPERILDAAVVLDTLGRAKNIPALTAMLTDKLGVAASPTVPHGIVGSDADDPEQLATLVEAAGGAKRKGGKKKPAGPAAPPSTGPGFVPEPAGRVAAVSAAGQNLLSTISELLLTGVVGGGKENQIYRGQVRRMAGLPDRPLAGTELARTSLASSAIAGLAEQFPELLPFVREYRPDHPLLGAQPGTRVPATKRGRRGGPVGPVVSGSTAVQPYFDPLSTDLAESISKAIFDSNYRELIGGDAGATSMPFAFGGQGFSDLDNVMQGMNTFPGLSKIGDMASGMKNAFMATRPMVGIMQDFDDAVMRASEGSLDFSQALDAATSSGSGLISTFKDTAKLAVAFVLTQNAANAIYRSISHLSSGFIQFNQALEDAKVGFSTLFYNAGDSMGVAEGRATGMIDRLKEFANITPFYFTQLQEAAVRMQAFGFNIGDVIQRDESGQLVGYIKDIGDAVAALGGGDERIMRITYALGQMRSAGRVYQNDMMQLANAGIAGYEILSEALIQEIEATGDKMTNEQRRILNDLYANPIEAIRRLTTAGRISGKAASGAIIEGLGEKYGGGMERLSKTMTGAMSTISDMSQSLVAVMTGPLYNAIRDLLVRFSELLQQKGTYGIFVKIGQSLQGFANTLREAIPASMKVIANSMLYFGNLFAKVFGGSETGSAIDFLRSGIATIGDLLSNNLVRAAVVASLAIKALMTAVSTNPLVATITLAIAALGALRNAYETNFLGFADTVDQAAAPLMEIGPDIAEALIPAIKALGAAAAQIIGGGLVIALKAALPLISSIAAGLGAMAGVLEKLAPLIGSLMGAFVVKKAAIEGMAILTNGVSGLLAGLQQNMQVAAVEMSSYGRTGASRYGILGPTKEVMVPVIDPATGMPLSNPETGEPMMEPKTVSAMEPRGIGISQTTGFKPGDFAGQGAAPSYFKEHATGIYAGAPIPYTGYEITGEVRPDGMAVQKPVTRYRALGEAASAEELALAQRTHAKTVQLLKAGLLSGSIADPQITKSGRSILLDKYESDEKLLALESGLNIDEYRKMRDERRAEQHRENNARKEQGLNPLPIDEEYMTPAQRVAAQGVEGLQGLAGSPTGLAYEINKARALQDIINRRPERDRNLPVTAKEKIEAAVVAAASTIDDIQLMGGGTEAFAEMTGMASKAAMTLGGLGMAVQAITSAFGMQIDGLAQASQGLIGFAAVLQTASQVALAIAPMGGVSGILGKVGGFFGKGGGMMGLGTLLGGLVLANEAVNSANKAAVMSYEESRANDRKQMQDVAKTWKDSGLAVKEIKKDPLTGQASYSTKQVIDDQIETIKKSASEMDELVASGMYTANNLEGETGVSIYTPTKAGKTAGYLKATVEKEVAAYQSGALSREAMRPFDSQMVAFNQATNTNAAARIGSEMADKLYALVSMGIMSRDDGTSLITELAAGAGMSSGAVTGEKGMYYAGGYRLPTSTLPAAIIDPAAYLAENFGQAQIDEMIFSKFGLGGKGMAFTGEFNKEGTPDEALFSTSDSLKLLNESLDDAQKNLDKLSKALAKIFDPFATAFDQFLSRAMELLNKTFAEETAQLKAEQEDAIYNVDALHNGEIMRLGVLEEQYTAMKEQRAEQEKLNALNDAQENAARATLGLFDAQKDPIEAAIAAREAAKKLQEEEADYQLSSMETSIEQAKNSVQYQQVSTYYQEKEQTLGADQQERARRLQERAQKLLKDIQEGKIKAADAQEEFYAMFGDAGLPIESILATGQFQGEALADIMGTAFATRFQELGDIISTTMADVVRAAMAAAAAEANVDAIVAQQERVEKGLDKISKKKVLAERDRLKGVVTRAQAGLTGFAIENKGTQAAKEAAGVIDNLGDFAVKLQNMPFDGYDEFIQRSQFNEIFDGLYAQFDAIYKKFGDLPTIARTGGEGFAPSTGSGTVTKPPKPTYKPPYATNGDWVWSGTAWNWQPMAAGGPVGAGQYIVGERGPEMLTMFQNGGGYVTPNHQLPSSMQSSSGALKAGKQGRYYGGLVGVTGRAGGGYVGPVGKDDPFWSPTDSFQRSLGFVGDPMGFQQNSFNEFMANPNNTKAQKNEMMRRYPKNYARYVASKIRGGGRMGWSPVMGRAAGGYVGRGRGPIPMDDPITPEPPIPPEPPTWDCPPGYIKVWSEGGYYCEKVTTVIDPPEPPIIDPDTATIPFNWKLYPMLLDSLGDIAANVEFPYTVDPKTGKSRPIPGARTQIFAPFGPGEGGETRLLDEVPGGQFGDEVTQAAGGPVRMQLKPGPNHGGEVGAVVRGGTGWKYKYGWFAQLAKLPFIKGTPFADLLLQPGRLLPHLQPNELGIVKTVGDPNVSPQSRGAKFYPEGVGGKGRGILEDFFKHSNLLRKAERKMYPFWKKGSIGLSSFGWATDLYEAQEKDGNWWEKRLEQIRIEEMSEAYWVNKKREFERNGTLESELARATLNENLQLGSGPLNFTESITGIFDSFDPNKKYDTLKDYTIAEGLASGDFNPGPPIVLSEATKEELDKLKEPLGRSIARVGFGALAETITAVKLAAVAPETLGGSLLASLALTTGAYHVGNKTGGMLWDLPGGIADVVGKVAPFIGYLGQMGWESIFGKGDPGGTSYEDLVKQNKQDYGIPFNLGRAFFDTELLTAAEKEQAQDKMLAAQRMIIPPFMWRPENIGKFRSSEELFSLMGMEPRWVKNYTEMLPGFTGFREWSKVMPKNWNPVKGGTGSTMVGGKSTEPVARAFGGPIKQYTPYLVGERGPELMIPDSSGYMLPNTGLQALQAPGDLRMAGGGATINASVTINNPVVSDAADIDKLAEKVSSAQVRTLRAAGFMRPS